MKAAFPISYADAYAAALAEIQRAVLLTGEPQFKALEHCEGFTIEWLER